MDYGGYTDINICGLYWMQGCNDRSKPTEYKPAFEYFAADVRADVAEIMKKYTGTNDDCGAGDMPIVVGTISQTQNLTSSGAEATNIAFINMQKKLPNTVSNCYVIDNSQFAITSYSGSTTPIVYGSDQWHWNQKDALLIGKNAGDKLLEANGHSRSYRYSDYIEITEKDISSWREKLSSNKTEFEIGTAVELLSLFRYLNGNATKSLTRWAANNTNNLPCFNA